MKKGKMKKAGFPFGVFLFLLLALLLLSAAIAGGYFYFNARRGVAEIEHVTREYSTAVAEALADVAEMSYRLKDYSKLQDLFREKLNENLIDEAFFVLADGRLIAHSNSETAKNLGGYLAADEFTYNMDLILGPVLRKDKDLQFVKYNIIDKKVPFRKFERQLIKQYLYPDFLINGWLVTRAVFAEDKKKKEVAIGSINFIIGKERIYQKISASFREGVLLCAALGAVSVFIALCVSLIVFIQYRRIARKSLLREEGKAQPLAAPDDMSAMPSGREGAAVGVIEEMMEEIQPHGPLHRVPVHSPADARHELIEEIKKPVKDAIAIKKRRIEVEQ